MEDILKTVIPLIIGAFVGGLITSYFDHKKTIIGEVWVKRFDQYKKLWAISGNLPKWPRDEQFSSAKLYNVNIALKNWYFNDGGLLLSKRSRKKYEEVQKLITSKSERNSEKILDPDIYEKIRLAFSDLRSSMTKDMSSRNRKLLE